ncbi:hypothetical protein BDB00DRAFT_880174 [Zychaea mexicana]|uniref:uncharacterized protein n=1 Tax=Zychaea mexicana TaxID=64656 RepID=UPI0022FE109C|nr:uncharacterized protein BDB00DRAFT_880174 [Zychaea mexicana]KAI9469339.1 hypothetical protein BDB00DRAFT_880174 [Zychaea mexicana]
MDNFRCVLNKRKTVDKYKNDGRAPDTAQVLKKANWKNRKYTVEVSDCDTGGDDSSSSEQDGDKWPIYDKIVPRDIQDSDWEKNDDEHDACDIIIEDDSGSSEVPFYTRNGSVNRADDLLSLSSDEEMDDGSLLPSQYYDGYLLNLRCNSNGSYYIDAPMEMMLQSIMPNLSIAGRISFNQNNDYDEALRRAYLLYQANDKKKRMMSMRDLRDFVWMNTEYGAYCLKP